MKVTTVSKNKSLLKKRQVVITRLSGSLVIIANQSFLHFVSEADPTHKESLTDFVQENNLLVLNAVTLDWRVNG